MSMLTVVAIASLSLAVISFLIFGYQMYLRRTQVTHQNAKPHPHWNSPSGRLSALRFGFSII